MAEGGIYLDYQASTPLDGRVAEAMWGSLASFGNPHSVEHVFGWDAEELVEKAKIEVAAVTGFLPEDVVLTSGATEANNLALKGLAESLKAAGRRHVLVSEIEHACVLAAAMWLVRQGFEIERIPVGKDGVVDTVKVKQLLRPDTGLVSVMLVNNEIGTIQPIAEIAEAAHAVGAMMHCDAAQGLGRVELRGLGVDMLSLSAHKAYGPKGIGALVANKATRAKLEPQILGGGQQKGLRSGTLAPMLCVGFGEAVRLAEAERVADNAKAKAQLERFEAALQAAGVAYSVQGSRTARIAQNLNLRFVGIPTDALQVAMPEVAFSSGAACTTEGDKASHVLEALGMDAIDECFRIAVGRMTRDAEIDSVVRQLIEVVKTL